MNGRPPPVAPRARLMDLLSLGFSVPIAVVGGGAAGWMLDRWLGTRPWLFLVFLVFGIVAGLRNVIQAATRSGGELDEKGTPGSHSRDRTDSAG